MFNSVGTMNLNKTEQSIMENSSKNQNKIKDEILLGKCKIPNRLEFIIRYKYVQYLYKCIFI